MGTATVGKLDDFGRDDVAVVGGKAANLGELRRAGMPVPDGFVVTTAAYREFVDRHGIAERLQPLVPADPAAGPAAFDAAGEQIRALFAEHELDPALLDQLRTAYGDLGEPAVAVRSSATAEDLAEASFAGQQDTYLNVQGADAVARAVRDCWASLWTGRALHYRAQHGIAPDAVDLAVVVQELVAAEAAGVLFTANPANGRRSEVVIAAAWGLGEAVVSGQVDTDEIVVHRPELAVVRRRVADKAVHTVRTDDGTTEEPLGSALRTASVLDDAAAVRLAALAVRIEDHYGVPQDVEWTRVGGEFFVVQARPVTALPPAEADPPTSWPIDDPTALYVRASIVEQLPDPLSPLFADLIDPAVGRSLVAMVTELVGPGIVGPGDVGLPTVNGYAYYRYDRWPMIRLTAQTPRALPIIGGNEERSGRARWRRVSLPRYREIVAGWSARDVPSASSAELVAGLAELVDAGAEYYTAVQTVIPLAATSEVAFTRFYEALVRRAGEPPAPTFLLGFDSQPIAAEKSLWDLAEWLRSTPDALGWFAGASSEEVLADPERHPDFARRLQEHLDRYGHAVYNLDFVNPVPADQPGPLVDTVRFMLRDDAVSPYVRQQRLVDAREDATARVRDRLDPARRRLFDRLLHWAQDAAPDRENALADIGLAWPVLRRILAELGGRLVTAGVVAAPDDVCWLRFDELRRALTEGARPPEDLRPAVEQRRALWRGQRRVTPPQVLPEHGLMMTLLGRMLPATNAEQTGDVLTGIGGSMGRVTAVARVLGGPEDFAAFQPGEVLVAAITTPAWTSLFSRAAAVVTDVGGPLSHSSIVAREYGIPAVLGTGVATRRIVSGQTVTVDGDRGKVLLGDAEDHPARPPERPGSGRRRALVAALGGAAAAVAYVAWRRRSGRRAGRAGS